MLAVDVCPGLLKGSRDIQHLGECKELTEQVFSWYIRKYDKFMKKREIELLDYIYKQDDYIREQHQYIERQGKIIEGLQNNRCVARVAKKMLKRLFLYE